VENASGSNKLINDYAAEMAIGGACRKAALLLHRC